MERCVTKSILNVHPKFILSWNVGSIRVIYKNSCYLNTNISNLRSYQNWNKTLIGVTQVDQWILV